MPLYCLTILFPNHGLDLNPTSPPLNLTFISVFVKGHCTHESIHPLTQCPHLGKKQILCMQISLDPDPRALPSDKPTQSKVRNLKVRKTKIGTKDHL